jgi:drug/metabolite transporter (DMT)-like permease
MKKYYPIILAVISAALFGVSTPASKLFLNELNPFLLAGLLYLGAGLGLIIFRILVGKKPDKIAIKGNNLRNIIGMVIFGGILGPVFLLFGLRMASSGSVSLWLNMESIATAVLGYLFFKEHLGKMGWIGVFGAVCAGLLLSVNEQAAGFLPGILILIACICWGLDNHFTALIDGITPTESTIIKGIIAGTVNFIIGLLVSGSFYLDSSILYAMIIGLFSYGISIVLYITAAQNMGAIRSQIFFSSAPFWGLFFSYIILKEDITILQLLSGGIFLISILYIIFEKHSHIHFHKAIEHIHMHRHDDFHHNHIHEGNEDNTIHIHPHKHGAIQHDHPHLPDIHHRHDHK